jgi:hypothetical protein
MARLRELTTFAAPGCTTMTSAAEAEPSADAVATGRGGTRSNRMGVSAGRYHRERWKAGWEELFRTHELVHNKRRTVSIAMSIERDGAFAVVDVDTLWRKRTDGALFHWKRRACKGYTKIGSEWLVVYHTGPLGLWGVEPPPNTACTRPARCIGEGRRVRLVVSRIGWNNTWVITKAATRRETPSGAGGRVSWRASAALCWLASSRGGFPHI